MKAIFGSGVLFALSASFASAQTVVGRNEETWSTRETLSRGQQLRLTSPNGTITVSPGSGNEVEIRAEKIAERGERIEEIGFVVKKSSEGLIVCAVYDDGDDCDLERGYRSRRENRWRDGRRMPRVSFTVRVPAGVMLQTETGNGDVAINGAGGDVKVTTGNGRVLINGTTGRVVAHTGNGRVTIDDARGPVQATTGNGDVRVVTASGPVSARSGNGDIDVSMARMERAAEMSFSTGSGRIMLTVPAGFGAEIDGSTGNGAISSDIPMRVEGRLDPRHIRGTLGGGGERLALHSGNGDITIRRGN